MPPASSLEKPSHPSPTAIAAAPIPNSAGTDRGGFWRVFISTFGAIFLAELGDKTQLATLMMSAESGNPWIVFLGAGSALIMTSLIGVAVGQWVSKKVSPHTLDTAAGVVLLVITVGLLWDIVKG